VSSFTRKDGGESHKFFSGGEKFPYRRKKLSIDGFEKGGEGGREHDKSLFENVSRGEVPGERGGNVKGRGEKGKTSESCTFP